MSKLIMFNNLTQRLSQSLRKIINKGRLTEENIKDTIREVRKALLEADVTLSVIKKFIDNVQNKSIGHKINKSLSPGQEFIKIVKNELIFAMGKKNNTLNLSVVPPAVILLIGLQGAGKTTSLAKIAKWIKDKNKKKILIVSTDIYRAAAIKQLQILSQKIEIDFFPSSKNQTPIAITEQAIQYAKLKLYDVLLIDTAGRLHNKLHLMEELKKIVRVIKKIDSSAPHEKMLIVDACNGQNIVQQTETFHQSLSLTGIVITKLDGTAKGGVIFSLADQFKIPIRYIGIGEKTQDLGVFNSKEFIKAIFEQKENTLK